MKTWELGGVVEAEAEPRPGGPPASLSALYLEQHDAMVRLAYLLTGSRAVAEDLVQDAFVRLHQRWESVQHPRPYLRTSVVNACRGYHRRNFRERARYAELAVDTVSRETPMILDAVAWLPYRQRAALVLRFYEDLPEQAIAEVLRCRPSTVRSLIHRGLLALREVMEP